jgi:hypothetical protein
MLYIYHLLPVGNSLGLFSECAQLFSALSIGVHAPLECILPKDPCRPGSIIVPCG